MSDMSTINSSTSDAIDQLVIDSGRMHKVINGTAAESVTVEDGSLIPSLRKAILDNLYYQTPILPWVNGGTTQVFNQLYAFTEVSSGAVSWWYAPSATATNPVSMKASPATDSNWRVVLDSATLTGLYATIDSPSFTGVPLAPTVDVDDNSDSIATTKFVNALIAKILQDVSIVNAEVANLRVTGDAQIFSLTTPTANITTKLTVQDLEILGDVTGIQTTVDGQDIAPKSITTTEKLEVGGDTTLHGAFKLADKTILLGDGTVVDLTNIGSPTTITVSPNLNQEVGNGGFVWDTTTLNAPELNTSGRGISIAQSADAVTQIAYVTGEFAYWIRSLSAGVWTAWESLLATASDTSSNTKAVSPAGVRMVLGEVGLADSTLTNVQDLNNLTEGQLFAYNATATNAPNPGAPGRGITLASAVAGEVTQLAIETVSGMMFTRTSASGAWTEWKEFEGKEGPQGPAGVGEKGEPGDSAYDIYVGTVPDGEEPLTREQWVDSLKGESFAINAQGTTAERDQYDAEAKDFSFLDTTTGLLYIKNSATSGDWSDGIPFLGEAGKDGATWLSGTVVPTNSIGKDGDFYLLTTTNDVYKMSSGVWAIITNLKGTKGDTGEAGATWLSGTTVPASSLGNNGDFYLHTATYDIYKKTSGAWAVIANIKGGKGDTGNDGADGVDGAAWFYGTDVPASSLGADGDYYLTLTAASADPTNGDVYHKATGAWTLIGNLQGPAGSGGGGGDGAKWYNGVAIPSNTLGADGDYYLQTTAANTDPGNGDVYAKASGVWTKQGNIKGADGSGSGTIPFATTAEAKAATSTTVVMSPARVREYMENHGFTASFTTTATDLNLVVTGDLFNYSATTLNHPGTGGYGRGICIPSGTGYVTQLAIENDSNLMFIRYQTDGTWGAWAQAGGSGGGSVTFATTAEAQAGTSTTVAMSPARTREQFEPLGFGSTYTNEVANLNTLTKGQFFNWGATSTNTPVASSYGRGVMIPAGTGYATQLGIVNDSGAMYVRFNNGGTWSAWVAVGGGSGTLPIATASVLGGVKIGTGVTVAADGTISVTGGGADVMKPSGTGHAAGLAPDPGATAGKTKFLREDATWAVPAGGGGGGSTTFTSALLADMNLVGGGSATSSFVSSGVTIDPTKIYKISAVLLLRTGAGNTVDLKLDGVGPDMFGMSIQYANASGVAAMARSEQATSNVTMTLPADVSVIILDGTMHSSYYGPNGPQVVLSTGSSGWGALLKGSCWTLTPVGTYPST